MLTTSELEALVEAYPDLRPALPRMGVSLARHARPFHLWPEAPLLFVDQDCADFHALLSGVVQVFLAGESRPLYTLRAGEFCPLTIGCLLSGDASPARVVAVTQVRVVAIDRRFFLALVQHAPAFRLAAFRSLANYAIRRSRAVPAWPNPLPAARPLAVQATH